MKRFLLICFLAVASMASFAQPGGRDNKEMIEQLRIAFITEELDLTSKEGQQFWPLFNEFSDGRKSIRTSVKKTEREMSRKDVLTENDILAISKAQAQALRDEADLIEEFTPKFIDVLGPARTAKLIRAEERFKRRMLERIEQRRGNR